MRTLSHLLMTALINRKLPKHGMPQHTLALLVGAVLPDFAFVLLTLGYEVYYRWVSAPPPNPYSSIMEYLHFDLFFNDPIWIVAHNTFHSLVVNLLLLLIGYVALKYTIRWGSFLFWLATAMLLHTVVDMFTHTSDGPLIFFPLNWTYRFSSPISYWETGFFGGQFIIIEYTVDLIILVYFARLWWKRRRLKSV